MISTSWPGWRFRPTRTASSAYASRVGMPTAVMAVATLTGGQGTPRRTPRGVPDHGRNPRLVAPVEVPGAAPEALVAVGGRLDAVRVLGDRAKIPPGGVGEGTRFS